MRIAVANVYKNRINLAATLKDTKTVVSKLERMVGVALHLVAILFYLTIFNVRCRHRSASLHAPRGSQAHQSKASRPCALWTSSLTSPSFTWAQC